VLPLRKDDQHFLSSSRRNGLPLQNIVFVAHLVFDEFLRVVLGAGGQRAALQLEKEGGERGANKKIAPAFLADFQGIPHQLGTCSNPPGGTRFRRHTLTRPLHYGLVPLLPAKRCVLCGWWGGRATASGVAQNRSNANHAVFGLMSTVARGPLRRHQYGATVSLA
jgi:hypothetical protein